MSLSATSDGQKASSNPTHSPTASASVSMTDMLTLHPTSAGMVLPPISILPHPLTLPGTGPPTSPGGASDHASTSSRNRASVPILPRQSDNAVPGIDGTKYQMLPTVQQRQSPQHSQRQNQMQYLPLPPMPPSAHFPPNDYHSTFWTMWHEYQKTHGQARNPPVMPPAPFGPTDIATYIHQSPPQQYDHIHTPYQQNASGPTPRKDSTSDSEDNLRKRFSSMTSEEILAEKRRRNAGASARFRDRRKKREQELQERCLQLEKQRQNLVEALRQYNPNHPQLLALDEQTKTSTPATLPSSPSARPPPSSPPATSTTDNPSQSDEPSSSFTLNDRVSQLEWMMNQFGREKERDTHKLKELEQENAYLRSLLSVHTKHKDEAKSTDS